MTKSLNTDSLSKKKPKNCDHSQTSVKPQKLDMVETLLQVQHFYSAGQHKQAQRLCKEVIQVDAFNEMALGYLGIISHRLQEWSYARDCFLRLTSLKMGSQDETVFYNLGNSCIMLDDMDLAFAAFSKTIELNPEHASAYNNLGVILEKRGDFEDSIDYFYDACELDPQHALSRLHLISVLSYLHRYDECTDLIEDSLSINTMTPDQRGTLLIQQAINTWITGEFAVCKRALRLCKHVLPHMLTMQDEAEAGLRRLISLLEYRSLHPEVYSGDYDRELYFIGDEQCLYSSGTLLRMNELDYHVNPFYVAHGSAQSVGAKRMNYSRAGLEVAIEQIPAKSPVLLGFGYEDARPSSTLFSKLKSSDDMLPLIEELIGDYVGQVIECCKEQDLKPIFVGIAACAEDLRDFSVEDQIQYFKMLALINSTLTTITAAHQAGFIDIYAATVGENGRSNQQYHMNEQYLTPSALPDIIEYYLIKPEMS